MNIKKHNAFVYLFISFLMANCGGSFDSSTNESVSQNSNNELGAEFELSLEEMTEMGIDLGEDLTSASLGERHRSYVYTSRNRKYIVFMADCTDIKNQYFEFTVPQRLAQYLRHQRGSRFDEGGNYRRGGTCRYGGLGYGVQLREFPPAGSYAIILNSTHKDTMEGYTREIRLEAGHEELIFSSFERIIGQAPSRAELHQWAARLNDDYSNGLRDLSISLNSSTRGMIALEYIKHLGRRPDAGGWDYWSNQVDNGVMTLQEAGGHIGNSVEAKIRKMYKDYLLREPDRPGMIYWKDQVDSENQTLEEVEGHIRRSEECHRRGTNCL